MKKNILIVEDEMIIAASTEIIIEELGHNSIGIASDLEQTKEFINDYSIDLVLLDINLGLKDVDGIEIANYLNSVHIPHIFTTSYSDKNTLEAALNQNPLGYIVKPLNMATLYTQLELAFRKIDETYIKIKMPEKLTSYQKMV